MLIQLQRIANGPESTLGFLRLEDRFECFTLEDQYQEVKVKHETRIPAGKYQIKFREEPSPKTNAYRHKFDWFNWHLQILDVPGFDYVYLHIGNNDDDTSGCILLGYGAQYNMGDYEIERSTPAFRAFYAKVSQALKANEKVFIEISSI